MCGGQDQFEKSHGIVRPVDGMALSPGLWMRRWGWTREDLGRVAIAQREHALRNPAAMARKPLAMED